MKTKEKQRKRLWEEAAGHCIYCGHAVSPQDMAVDHIIPLSKGGENHYENKVCSCPSCNAQKANREVMDFLIEIPNFRYRRYVHRLENLENQGKMLPGKVQRLLGFPRITQGPEVEPAPDSFPEEWHPQVLCHVYVTIRD